MPGFREGEPYPSPFHKPYDGPPRGPRINRDLALSALSGPRMLTTGPSGPWIDQSPQYLVEGETIPFVVTFRGITTCASPASTLYLDGTDVSSTSLSGSTTASTNVVITKSVTSVTGPNRYILAVTAEANSVHTQVKKLLIIVGDPADEAGGTSWIQEGPQWAVEGESMVFTLALQGAMSISGTPTAKAYKDGTDVTSTNLSGSCTVSGLTITLPTFASVVGGRYVIAVTASVDGRTEIHKILVYGQNVEDEL